MMKKIAIMTDSNSGITQKQAEELGITVLPMPFFINRKMYLEDIDLTQEDFYRQLTEDEEISTSQPSPADLTGTWKRLLKDYDEVVHIPMSSGLSASCETATALAADFDGRVQVVNNQRISVTQKQSVRDAIELAAGGMDAAGIKELLERESLEASIYLVVETLKYLKKGGRVTPAAAALGTILNLKPVLQIQGEKLDAFAKARGKIKAKKIMLDAMKKDLETRFAKPLADGQMRLHAAYAGNPQEAKEWEREIAAAFPGMEFECDPLSLSVACHVGPGVLAVACSKRAGTLR